MEVNLVDSLEALAEKQNPVTISNNANESPLVKNVPSFTDSEPRANDLNSFHRIIQPPNGEPEPRQELCDKIEDQLQSKGFMLKDIEENTLGCSENIMNPKNVFVEQDSFKDFENEKVQLGNAIEESHGSVEAICQDSFSNLSEATTEDDTLCNIDLNIDVQSKNQTDIQSPSSLHLAQMENDQFQKNSAKPEETSNSSSSDSRSKGDFPVNIPIELKPSRPSIGLEESMEDSPSEQEVLRSNEQGVLESDELDRAQLRNEVTEKSASSELSENTINETSGVNENSIYFSMSSNIDNGTSHIKDVDSTKASTSEPAYSSLCESEKPQSSGLENEYVEDLPHTSSTSKKNSVDRMEEACAMNAETEQRTFENKRPSENEREQKEVTRSKTSGNTESNAEMETESYVNAEKDGSIEFAEVNFDDNDNNAHEKQSDKVSPETSTTKPSKLDPIASAESSAITAAKASAIAAAKASAIPEELESMESSQISDSQGADEAMTIIPDSEREITEAEKEAAASLPTLKDISDKTQPDETGQEITPEDEIKVYKYDKELKQECYQCKETNQVKFRFSNKEDNISYICNDTCLTLFKADSSVKVMVVTDESTAGLRVKNFAEGRPKESVPLAFVRKCASCSKVTDDMEVNLTWEIMDFCNEFCLSKYQKMIGSKCSSCSGDVKSASLGKYCVRFGNDIRQFCTSSCLEQYKNGLKVCSYCQQDMSNGPEGFLAPVGEKGQFKDFCSKLCMDKYDIMTKDKPPVVQEGTVCSVCKVAKGITMEFDHDGEKQYFCGEPCFVAFAFVNKIQPGKCAMCRRNFSKTVLEQHTMYYDNVQYSFCSNSCENIYIIAHRKIVPCSWCKVKKYNFDMIKKYSKASPVINMCSINCLNMYQLSLNVVSAKSQPCNYCKKQSSPAYHLTMSDATLRNFCSYSCVMSFQNQFPKQLSFDSEPFPAGGPQKTKRGTNLVESGTSTENINLLPVIASVQSLANTNGTIIPPGLTPIATTRLTRSKSAPQTVQQTTTTLQMPGFQSIDLPVQIQTKQHFIVKEKPQPDQRNIAIMCQPRRAEKGLQATPQTKDAACQTSILDEDLKKILVPVPVPIYVPTPCHMFAAPVPIPVPFPLPIPIPIFIPTSRNSAAGILKEIKKIQVKIPTDPYEAELLMMAEMVAEEKKEEPTTDSESDIDDNGADDGGSYSPEPVDTNNTFGDDMLQMALKMATELDEPAVDLEGALTANTITAPQTGGHPTETHAQEESVDDPQVMHPQVMHPQMMERGAALRGRKRSMRGSPRGSQSKRGRRLSQNQTDMPIIQPVAPPPLPEPQEKPDANMCLKYTFGVNAWKQWVTTKNAELEKSSRRLKLFKTEILQLTADELNYSLCLFVKEVRKPNGQEYAPDTIYYLCLGIQQYLFENGRIDNIFCDPYYEKFTDCLDEVAKKFSVLYNDSHYIVTRVEEEHLWESKQLGAHSPHVLLSTLMFFNTKHFNLTTVDEHMQLSFSHIMKHWKRNPNQPGASKVPGSRNVLLRFYPPQSALQNNQRKKKVYEQQENEENPLRCPVKLYEFYLSKCPESVKTRNDVFYLQPERSCVPDSPVWYSTMPLPKEALEKMLHRVKMVKEINVALLTS